jgi:hypothetical protein
MTKGRAALPLSVVAEQDRFSSPWVGRRTVTSPVEMTKGRVVARSRGEGIGDPQISPLRSFGTPVEMTKGRVVVARSRSEGIGDPQISPLRSFGTPVEMTKGRVVVARSRGVGTVLRSR